MAEDAAYGSLQEYLTMLFLALLLLTALWIATRGMRVWRRVASAADDAAATILPQYQADDESSQPELPKVSVVSYVLGDTDTLPSYIDTLLEQDYPALEVVLVCDASAEATAAIAERFENVKHLRFTFIPPGSHNLSRRKLAQTIGIKAATGDVVIFTSSSVIPSSRSWVSAMAEPFIADPTLAVALGYVRPVPSDFTGSGRWYRQFDHLIDTSSWMYNALIDDAYRGDGYNMAIRRSLFFDNKGYASTTPLMDGDDDIFIRELSRYGRVCLRLRPESIVDTCWGESANRRHLDLKDRRMFTRRYLPRRPFLRQGMLSCAQWLLLLSALLTGASAILDARACEALINYYPMLSGVAHLLITPDLLLSAILASLALVVLAATWVMETLLYRRMAGALGAAKLCCSLVPFMLWRPIGNVIFNVNHRTSRKSHFTWQR